MRMRATVAGIEHNLVLRPVAVQCDSCNEQYAPACGGYWRYDRGVAEKVAVTLRAEGWTVSGDRHVCPRCTRNQLS